jgi:glucokinase
MTKEIVVGIDLGGTYLRVGVFQSDGSLLSVVQQPIEAHKGGDAGIQRIITMIDRALKECGGSLIGIGMGSTGPLDSALGIIQNPYTLPGWENVPILPPLIHHFQVPAVLENDADVAALGEYWAGAGKGIKRLYAVTVGTGIGTALILDGHIYRGADGIHPEGGHHIVDPSGPLCYCGANGCWEAMAAGPAIARRAQQDISNYPTSQLLKLSGNNPDNIDAHMVAEAAKTGDACALSIMEKTAFYLSVGLVNCIALIMPEMIVLSGGVMKSADLLMPQILASIQNHNKMQPVNKVKIVTAKLGYHAGLYGAAYAILQLLEESK